MKNKLKKIIAGDVLQLVVDKDYIYVVDSAKNLIRYKKDGTNGEAIISGSACASIIQDEKNIYLELREKDF